MCDMCGRHGVRWIGFGDRQQPGWNHWRNEWRILTCTLPPLPRT